MTEARINPVCDRAFQDWMVETGLMERLKEPADDSYKGRYRDPFIYDSIFKKLLAGENWGYLFSRAGVAKGLYNSDDEGAVSLVRTNLYYYRKNKLFPSDFFEGGHLGVGRGISSIGINGPIPFKVLHLLWGSPEGTSYGKLAQTLYDCDSEDTRAMVRLNVYRLNDDLQQVDMAIDGVNGIGRTGKVVKLTW